MAMVEQQINEFDHALVHAVGLFGEDLMVACGNSLEKIENVLVVEIILARDERAGAVINNSQLFRAPRESGIYLQSSMLD